MLRFIDISNHQSDIDLDKVLKSNANLDGVVAKATQGTYFTDDFCDGFLQTAMKNGKLWGFYHFADERESAVANADYFVSECENYFGKGVPILDWEVLYADDGCTILSNPYGEWINDFVNRVHEKTGVWPWIYANPWRFSDVCGFKSEQCGLWLAEYQGVYRPSFTIAESWSCPSVRRGNPIAWQFCSDGHVAGYNDNLDCSLFYGDENQWKAYAQGDCESSGKTEKNATFENEFVKINVEVK